MLLSTRPAQGCGLYLQSSPWGLAPGDTSHDVLLSVSSQGDMGALGPIGYPGPKGMKVR